MTVINFTAPTLADLKQAVADRKTSGKLPTDSATLTRWTRFLNRGAKYCIEKLRIQKTASVTVTSGVGTLPVDFVMCNQVVDSGDNTYDIIPPQNSEGVTGYYCWVTGNMSDGFSLNVPTDGTYTVYYTYRPYKMNDDADVCPFPDEEAVVAYAYAYLRRGESDPFEDAGISLAECDNRLREVESQFVSNEGGNTFTLPANA